MTITGRSLGQDTRNGMPGTGAEFRPYVYGTGDARRQAEVDRILAQVHAQVESAPDIEPGYEVRREQLAEDTEVSPALATSREARAAVPVPTVIQGTVLPSTPALAAVPDPVAQPAAADPGCDAMAKISGHVHVCYLIAGHPGDDHYDPTTGTHWRGDPPITHWPCTSQSATPAVTTRCARCGYLVTRCCCAGGPRS